MFTNILVEFSLGATGWIAIFGGSLLATALGTCTSIPDASARYASAASGRRALKPSSAEPALFTTAKIVIASYGSAASRSLYQAAIDTKLVQRVYREEGLAVRRRQRKRVAIPRTPLPMLTGANERWSMDVVSDALSDGRRFRALTIVDDFTRESPAIEVDTSLPGDRVVRVLETLADRRGLPKAIVCDTGPEFRGEALDQWADRRGIALQFIQPGKPIQNAFAESVNAAFAMSV